MSTFRLDGRTALVTGASRGIGAAIAEAYAAAGADVALMARDAERLAEVAALVEGHGRRAVVLPADVTDIEAVQSAVGRAVAELGHVDVVVNNAGGNSFSMPLAGMRFSGWEKTMRLNLDSVVHVTQAILPHLLERKSGVIVNVASVAGLRGAPMMSHYGAAKAALLSLTQSVALEEKGTLSRVPMSRWGRVREIADPAVFLASDASSFMTGQTLIVDGGLSAMP